MKTIFNSLLNVIFACEKNENVIKVLFLGFSLFLKHDNNKQQTAFLHKTALSNCVLKYIILEFV